MTPELTQLHMIVTQYHELVAHVAQHGDDQDGINLQFENMLSAALAAFAHDVDSVTPEAATRVVYQITTRADSIQELAQKGLTPFSCPITVEEFAQHSAGMIPLMLVKACVGNTFHGISMQFSKSPTWWKFVQLYARKLPSV